MQQKSQVDAQFLQGLEMLIDSISKSDDTIIKDDVDHWCPDVQEWHTADHESANPPSVHVNVDNSNGDDPYQSENEDVEKGWGAVAGKVAGSLAAREAGKSKNEDVDKEYDQNSNLEPSSQEGGSDSIAEPFLRRRAISKDGIKDALGIGNPVTNFPSDSDDTEKGSTHDIDKSHHGEGDVDKSHHEEIKKAYEQSIDTLKIWASVDRQLIKDDSAVLVDDFNILASFDLETNINAEDLVEGTIVHKMLVDRANRPTKEWWEASLNLAKSIENVEEPAFLAAYLYYGSDEFDLGDFISVQKTGEVDQRSEHGKPQDLEMPENSSGGDGMAGLGLASDNELEHGPDDDEDCD